MTGSALRGLFAAPLLLCGCAAQGASAQPVPVAAPTAAAEVQRRERAWLDAYERHDAALMDDLLAPAFIITFPDGRQDGRAEVLRQISGPARPDGPRFRTEGVAARGTGDTIVLTGTLVTAQGGREMRLIYTDTWVRNGARWQVLASHLGPAPRDGGQSQ